MNRLTSMSGLLDELSPDLQASGPGWEDVLARARMHDGSVPTRRHRLVLAFAVVCAVVIPVLALAASNDWWFFQFHDTPSPLSKPTVITQGSWNGHAWELVAYNSPRGTCWSITFPGSNEVGGAMASSSGPGLTEHADNALSCGGIVGIRPPNAKALHGPTIMYMLGASYGTDYPKWIAGPVVQSASTVVVRYPSAVVRVPTTRAVQLGHVGWYGPVRFFAAQLPVGVGPLVPPTSVTALDAGGRVVGCSVLSRAIQYFSPLSACS